MKKFMLILKNGVTITMSDQDVVIVGGAVCKIEELPIRIMRCENYVNTIHHETKEVKVDYYVPGDIISWCYVQEVIENEQTSDKEQS